MPRTTISERIYETFFAKLAKLDTVSQETLADLRRLYQANQLGNKRQVVRLVKRIEERHGKDKDTDR